MFRFARQALSLVTLCAFLASGLVLVPPAADAWRIVRHWNEPDVAARVQLADLTPADYTREIEAALAADDPDLAQSLLALAARQRVRLPPDLAARTAAALAAQPGVLGQVWNGAVYGEGDTAAGFAATIASDLTVVGDLRDLVRQALLYPDYDPVVVALAAAGVGLTAVTVSSAGVAAPVKVGASILKLARRTGRLSVRLADDLLQLSRRAIDADALQAVWRASQRFDLAEARRLAPRVLRREAGDALLATGESVGTIVAARGPRAALDTLAAADTTAEVTRLARVADATGPAYRGALRLAPRLAKTVARASKAFLRVVGWLLTGLGWLLWLVWLTLRLVHRAGRLATRAVSAVARRLVPHRLGAAPQTVS